MSFKTYTPAYSYGLSYITCFDDGDWCGGPSDISDEQETEIAVVSNDIDIITEYAKSVLDPNNEGLTIDLLHPLLGTKTDNYGIVVLVIQDEEENVIATVVSGVTTPTVILPE